MAYQDGEVFTTYCDKNYDRHTYKIVFKNGKSIVYDNYDIMKYYWYQYRKEAECVTIIDKGGGGF